MDEINIWRSAKQLIGTFGDMAEVEAARRADDALAARDREGWNIWLQIAVVTRQLVRKKPRASESMN
jgi:hypothetical protein